MSLTSAEVGELDAVNSAFKENPLSVGGVPIYRCNPQDTAEIAFLLFRAGYNTYCPYFISLRRKNRHCKALVEVPQLYFSGYLFITGKSPYDLFEHRLSRLSFGDLFASVDAGELLQFTRCERVLGSQPKVNLDRLRELC